MRIYAAFLIILGSTMPLFGVEKSCWTDSEYGIEWCSVGVTKSHLLQSKCSELGSEWFYPISKADPKWRKRLRASLTRTLHRAEFSNLFKIIPKPELGQLYKAAWFNDRHQLAMHQGFIGLKYRDKCGGHLKTTPECIHLAEQYEAINSGELVLIAGVVRESNSLNFGSSLEFDLVSPNELSNGLCFRLLKY